jgi:EmrB/QacA subfamily drug resistance transporter
MSEALPKDVRPIAIVVIAGAIMSILDTTIVNVALETLRVDLHAPLSTIQWVTTGYLLALAAVIPLTGWSAERFGARRVWMTAVGGFVVSSALCGLAWSAESLIAFRVLQGLAGGMIMPVGMITLAQAAGPQRMGRVMSVVGVPMLLAPVLGPVLGGLIVDNLSWRWIFYVNLPVGAIGLVLAAKLLPHGRAQGRAKEGELPSLDWRGLALLSPGVALVVFGLSEYGTHRSFAATSAWLPTVLGFSALVLFVRHAWRTEHPIVDVKLFRGRGFSAAASTTFLIGIALFGSMLLLPLYYQLARGESPLVAGLLTAPQGFGAAIGMSVGGRWTDRRGAAGPIITGIALLLVGTYVFTQAGAHTSYWVLSAGLVLRGLGLGGTMMPSMAAAYATLRSDQVPRATPQLNVLQRVGGSLGAAVLTVVLQNRIASNLGVGGSESDGLGGNALSAEAQRRIADPVSAAFAHTYWWAFVLTVLALVPAALLAREERRARKARQAGERAGETQRGERTQPPAAVAG